MSPLPDQLPLAFGFVFMDLYQREGLVRLDAKFLENLKASDAALFDRLMAARSNHPALDKSHHSDLIVELAPHVEDFIAELFDIAAEIRAHQQRHHALAPLYIFKRKFIQKRAISGITKEQAAAIDGPAVAAELKTFFGEPLTEASFLEHVSRWLEAEADHVSRIQTAQRYAAWAALSPAGIEQHRHGILFKVPHKLDQYNLVPVESIQIGGVPRNVLPPRDWRYREGFHLTDPGLEL